MALQKIEVPLVVSGGIDTKTDRKLVPDQKMIKTENVDFSKIGTLKKSKGTTQLTASTDTSDDLNDISSSIFSHNNEIIVLGKQSTSDIYSYSESDVEWKSKSSLGSEISAISCDIGIDQNSADYMNCFCSSLWEFPLAGFKIFATVLRKPDGEYKAVISKIDYNTGEEDYFEISLSGDAYEVRTIGIDDADDPVIWLVVSEHDVGTGLLTDMVTCYTFDKNISQVGSIAYLAQSSLASSFVPTFDVIVVDGSLFYVAAVILSEISIGYVGTNGSISSSNNYTISVASNIQLYYPAISPQLVYSNPNISCCLNGNLIYIAFVEYDASTINRDVYMFAVSKASVASVAKTETKIIDKTINPLAICRLNIFQFPEQSATDSLILSTSSYETASGGQNIKTDIFTVNWVSSPPTIQNRNISGSIYNCEIVSKAFTFGWPTEPDVFYYVMITSSYFSNTSTFILVKFLINGTNDWDRIIIGKFFESTAIDATSAIFSTSSIEYTPLCLLNEIVFGKDDKYYFPCVTKADLISGQTFIFKSSSVSINFNGESSNIVTTKLSQSTHLSGSVVREYDGLTARFSGFQGIPKAGAATSVSGSALPDGNHQYILIYVYYDNNGEYHRSDTSTVIDITTSSQSVLLSIDPLTDYVLNNEKDSKSEIWVYRAITGTGGPFYFLASLSSDTSSYIDNIADSALESREAIYTSGGVLSNSQVPAMSYIASGLNRIFGVSLEDKNKIYYSQKRIVENSIEWNPALYFRVDGHGKNIGEALGVANLDDKMIILKDDSVLYISGDGPLPTGEQNTFTEPVVVSQEIGCNEVRSIVETPVGVMFKGKKGIYIVDRALSVRYIGAAVEEYNSETITGSEVSKIRNEVYFQTANRLMVYNYLQDKWSTNTYLGGKSICIWKDQLTALKSDGLVYYQDDSLYTDNTANISMKVTTPWYKVKGITGFGRLYEVIILGEYKSDHTLNVRVYYDYDETDYGDYTFDVTSINIYEFSVKPSKQKCQSFKIEIWDTPTGGSKESLELTGISVRIGAKQGFYKLADSYKG